MLTLNVDRLQSLPDDEAWSVYRALVARGQNHPDVHLHGALIAQRLGQLHSAHAAVLEGLAGHPTGDLLGWLRAVYGIVLREIGHVDAAIEQFTLWLKDVAEYPTLQNSHLGIAYYNRGLALRQADRHTESLADYAQACTEFRRRANPTWLCMSLHNMAWAACLAGQSQVAAAALAEAQPLALTPAFAWHQKIGEALAVATSPDGDLHRVMWLCREIMACTDADVPPGVRSHGYWLAGRIAMELDLLTAAADLVDQALIWGAAAGDENRCLSDAAALYAEVASRTPGRT